MNRVTCRRATTVVSVLAALLSPLSAAAQDDGDSELGWFDTAELSFVATGGNAEGSSFSFENLVARVWSGAELEIQARALRTESATVRRFAVGTAADFEVRDQSTSELTAESYLLAGEYKRELSERTYWYARTSWERNEFSGVRNRYLASGGFGHRWWETERGHLRSFYGLSGTRQQAVFEDDGTTTFLGLRTGLNFRHPLTESTTFEDVLTVDENLDDTSDVRADWLNAISVSMSERLAIKLSLRLLFDNRPSVVRATLQAPDGTPSGETVLVEAEKLDSHLTVALVVDF